MKGTKDLIQVDGRSFQKTRLFGNWQAKVVFRNKKSYNRKKEKSVILD